MKYNRSTLHPPGPMLDVTVWPVGHADPARTLPGKLDTGADISIILPSLADDMQLVPEDSVVMVSYDGIETERTAYFVNLEIAGYKITLRGKDLTFGMVDP